LKGKLKKRDFKRG